MPIFQTLNVTKTTLMAICTLPYSRHLAPPKTRSWPRPTTQPGAPSQWSENHAWSTWTISPRPHDLRPIPVLACCSHRSRNCAGQSSAAFTAPSTKRWWILQWETGHQWPTLTQLLEATCVEEHCCLLLQRRGLRFYVLTWCCYVYFDVYYVIYLVDVACNNFVFHWWL
jgi:hypothetical protein